MKEQKKAQRELKRGKKWKLDHLNDKYNYSFETISHTHTEMWLFYHDDFEETNGNRPIAII